MTAAPLVLIHGTHGRADAWFRSGSPFVAAALAHGLLLAAPEPFLWSGRLGGLPEPFLPDTPNDSDDDAGRLEWANEGRHLTYYVAALNPGAPISIIAHSHGGNLAALAIAHGGLRVRHLVTVSTPVRRDMAPYYRRARARISGTWLHVYGDFWRDWWLKLGEFGDGQIGWRSAMPAASRNVHAAGAGHSTTLQDGTWFERLGVWAILAS